MGTRTVVPSLTTKLTIEASPPSPWKKKAENLVTAFPPPQRKHWVREKISLLKRPSVNAEETEKTVDSERDPLRLSLLPLCWTPPQPGVPGLIFY